MKRIPLTLLICISFSILGSATYDNYAKKDRPHYAADRIIVKYRAHLDSDQVNSAQSRVGNKLQELDSHTRVVAIAQGKSIEQSIAEATKNPDVEYAEPDYKRYVSVVPRDPYYPRQRGLEDIYAPEAWNISTGDASVIIAVIDSGVNSSHPDLAPNITSGRDFINDRSAAMDVYGHGTAVAGVAAGRGDNGIGIAGTSWGSAIMPLRASDFQGEFNTSDIIAAIHYAIENSAKIISVSFSGPDYSQAEHDAISRANLAGVLFVAAAGNEGCDLCERPVYPAAYSLPNMLTVASTDPSGNLSSFSNHGSRVHVAAPGEGVWTTSHSNRDVLTANFDLGSDRFTLDGNWVRTRSKYFGSPGCSLTNSIDSGRYQNNMDAEAASPQIDLTGAAGCKLQFMIYGSSEANHDHLSVETSTDGVNWAQKRLFTDHDGCKFKPCFDMSGPIDDWKLVQVDLADIEGFPSAFFRFRFTSDSSNTCEGFYIDNVTVTAAADGGYSSYSGTSFSAPYVSGLAALIWSEYPHFTAREVRNVILNSVTRGSGLSGRILTEGKINAFAALSSPNTRDNTRYTTASCGGESGGGGGCFIATAAFGSALAPEVVELRNFRDQILSRVAAGRWLIGQYYKYSPAAADFIRESTLLRSAARTALLPLAAAAWLIMCPAWLLGVIVLAASALFVYSRRRKEEI